MARVKVALGRERTGPPQCGWSGASRTVFLGLVAIVLSACSPPEPEPLGPLLARDTLRPAFPPAAPPSRERSVGGRIYMASVHAIETTPPLIAVALTARDSLRRPIDAPIAGCPVGLEVYRGAGREGDPVWRSAPLPGSKCPIGPPESYPYGRIERRYRVADILGDSLPPGQYHFTAVLDLAGDTVYFPTGSGYLYADSLPVTGDRSALRFQGETRLEGVAPTHLITEVRITNTGARRVELGFGGCALQVRAYRTPERTGTPAWRSELRTDPRNPRVGYGCPGSLGIFLVHPGASRTFSGIGGRVPVYEILADSLPEGRYYLAAELEVIDSSRREHRADTLRLPAGDVDLRRYKGPLPAEKIVGGLRYSTDLGFVSLGPDTLRARVTIENVSGARAELTVERGCPLHLYVFRSRKERDHVPMPYGAPAFPRTCGGEPHPFVLGPGESWTFHIDVPSVTVAGEVGSGRRYFTAIPRITPGPLISLSAGDALVRP